MAKLNENRSSLPFAAAVTAMSLGTGKRLMRNFHYYRTQSPETVHREECLQTYRTIRLNLFGLQNMYLDSAKEHSDAGSSFKVMLAKQIQDGLEELHRNILFFDAEQIEDLIPVLDRQRAFWAESTDAEFYSDELPSTLDRHLSSDLSAIEMHLLSLPQTS